MSNIEDYSQLPSLLYEKRVQRVLEHIVVQSKQVSMCRVHVTLLEFPVMGGTAKGHDIRCHSSIVLSLS